MAESALLLVKRRPLKRLPRDEEGSSQYLHPNGYVIVAARRTWSERVGAMRGQAGGVPLTWWAVYNHAGHTSDAIPRLHPWAYSAQAHRSDHDTLRAARAWCDEHPREGWR